MPRLIEITAIALVLLLEGLGIWLLLGCGSREISNGSKLVWLLVMVFTQWFGAGVYCLFRGTRRTGNLPQTSHNTLTHLRRGLRPHPERT